MRQLGSASKPSHLQAGVGIERAQLRQDLIGDVGVASCSFLRLAPVRRDRRPRPTESCGVERNRKARQQHVSVEICPSCFIGTLAWRGDRLPERLFCVIG